MNGIACCYSEFAPGRRKRGEREQMDSESFHYRGDYFVFVHFGQRATDNFDYSSFLSSLDVNQLCGHLRGCVGSLGREGRSIFRIKIASVK